MHAALVTIVLVADRLMPDPGQARVIEIAQVDIISAAEFDAAISQPPSVPDSFPDRAPGLAAPESRPPAVASDSPPPPDGRPAARPAPPPAQESRVAADTASDEPMDPPEAPRQPTAPRTTTPQPSAIEAPADVAVSPPPRPQSPAAPRMPDRMAAVDTTSPAPPEPEPEQEPEAAPEPAPAEQPSPEPAPPAPATEPPQPDRTTDTPDPAVPEAPRAVVPPARPRDLARRPAETEPATPEPEREPAVNPIDRLVEQAQQTATAPESAGAGAAGLTRAQRGMLISGIRRHFVPPDGIANARSLAVTFLIEVSRDGRITASQRVAPSGALDRPHEALRLRAVQALIRANEEGLFSRLPQDSYDTWRRMRITFTPEDLLL
jgi:hypothetical protein